MSQRAQLFDLVGPIGLRDARFLLPLDDLDVLRRDVAAFVHDQAADGHHVVAAHPLAIFLAEAQGGPGVGVVRVEFEDALQMPFGVGLQFMLAAPLGQFPVGVDRIRRRASEFVVFGIGIRRGIDPRYLRTGDSEPAAGGQLDHERRFVGAVGLDDLAFQPAAAGQSSKTSARAVVPLHTQRNASAKRSPVGCIEPR